MRKPIMRPRGKFNSPIELQKEAVMPEVEDFDYKVINIVKMDDGSEACDCLLLESGETVHTQHFSHSRAVEDAIAFGRAYVEVHTTSFEEQLGPFGIEWQREQDEER